MLDKTIYLDNAATTFPKSEKVYEIMDKVNRECAVNAGRGSYTLARKASRIIDDTKKKLIDLVDAPVTSTVVFTASITIAINIILSGITWQKGDVVYISPYEHNAVARTLEKIRLDKQIEIKLIPVNNESLEINISLMENMFISDKPRCVCCTGVSNVTGYILPTKEIFAAAKKSGAITVLDSAQSLGLVEQNMCNIDFLAFAGHKTLYGPLGIGGFIDNSNIKLEQVIAGGTGSNSLILTMPDDSPQRYEPSSFNIVAIAGLNAALDELNISENFDAEKKLTQYIIKQMQNIYNIRLYVSPKIDIQTGIISFNIRNCGLSADEVGKILDEEYNIAVRTGYHCAPYVHRLLHDSEYNGTVRIGLGKYNSMKDIDILCEALESLA